MKIEVGSKVKFKAEKQRYTVQASNTDFSVSTKPMNALHTVLYTIIDFRTQVRETPEDLVFGHGAETREQCEDMLDRLNGRLDSFERRAVLAGHRIEPITTEVSYRHRLALDIERIDPPKVDRP